MSKEETNSNDTQEFPTIVIDNGSHFMKAGFSGDECPKSVIPTVVGHPNCIVGPDALPKDFYLGWEAEHKRKLLNLNNQCPINNGYIENWDDMEKIWHNIFYNDLKVLPEEQGVLCTETALNSKHGREKMTQIMFETFNVPKFFVTLPSLLSLYGCGRFTGVSIDCGHGATEVASIYEGYCISRSIFRSHLCGLYLNKKIKEIFNEKNYNLGKYDIEKIKEENFHISSNFIQEYNNNNFQNNFYELPDGQKMSIGKEAFEIPELLFDPNEGIQKLLMNSIQTCNIEYHKDLFQNIILSGGTTFFKGFCERMEKEMISIAPSFVKKIKLICSPERRYSQWIGGSILSSLSSFHDACLLQDEYDEFGPSGIHRICKYYKFNL